MKNPLTAETIRDAVTRHYITTGKSSTIKDIAEQTCRSEATVRKVLNASGGAVQGTGYGEASVPTFSKDYPMMQVGSHKVAVFAPTMDHLREMIQAKNARLSAMREELERRGVDVEYTAEGVSFFPTSKSTAA
jgi:transposase